MGAASAISPFSLFSLPGSHFPSPFQTQFCNPSLISRKQTTSISRNKNLVFKSSSKDPKESNYFDQDGAVDDMDGYLNYISLEYDSVWDTKPSWCQPWTITLTGVSVIGGSWLVLHSAPITAVVCLLIFSWWYIFLYSYPKAYSNMIAERRKKVRNGVEDTFGLRKSQ